MWLHSILAPVGYLPTQMHVPSLRTNLLNIRSPDPGLDSGLDLQMLREYRGIPECPEEMSGVGCLIPYSSAGHGSGICTDCMYMGSICWMIFMTKMVFELCTLYTIEDWLTTNVHLKSKASSSLMLG